MERRIVFAFVLLAALASGCVAPGGEYGFYDAGPAYGGRFYDGGAFYYGRPWPTVVVERPRSVRRWWGPAPFYRRAWVAVPRHDRDHVWLGDRDRDRDRHDRDRWVWHDRDDRR